MPPDNTRKMKGNLPFTQSFSPNPYVPNSLYLQTRECEKDKRYEDAAVFHIHHIRHFLYQFSKRRKSIPQLGVCFVFIPYPTAFPYGNGMVLHFYQQQESSTTKSVHKVINKGLKTYVKSLHTGENFH